MTTKNERYAKITFVLTPEEKQVVERAIKALNFEDPNNNLKTIPGYTKRLVMRYSENVLKKYETIIPAHPSGQEKANERT